MALPSPSSPRTATVYCEGNLGEIDGKTANGLVRHSQRHRIVSVIDSRHAGRDSGTVLDGVANGIPAVRDLPSALTGPGGRPEILILGMAPASGLLGAGDREVVLAAMAAGLDVVSGLHEFLADDPEFVAAALIHDVAITDVRRPRRTADLRMFTGRIAEVTCPRIAVLGTDGAIGKRTTATILTRALRSAGLNAVMIGTGQTGLIQGARYGIALDAIPAQFGIGELEATVVEAFEAERPDVIVIEGQGALSHPAYISSTIILRGSRPAGVVLQHAPARTVLSDFPGMPMPTPESEIALIEAFADTSVIGMALNHEGMGDTEVTAAITRYEAQLGMPVTDALTRDPARLVDMVLLAFPELAEVRTPAAA